MPNRSLEFDGTGHLTASANAAYNFGTGDFTLEAWILPATTGTLISRKSTAGGPGNGGFLLVLEPGGRFKLATDDGSGFYEIWTDETDVFNGLWHHVAAVRENGQLRVYVNGSLLDSQVRTNRFTPLNISNNLPVQIGWVDQQQEPYRLYVGLMDDVRVWRLAHGETTLRDLAKIELTGDEDGLVGYWPFSFGTVCDFSPTNNQIACALRTTTTSAPVIPPGTTTLSMLFTGQYVLETQDGQQWTSAGSLTYTRMGKMALDGGAARALSTDGRHVNATFGGGKRLDFTFSLEPVDQGMWIDEAPQASVLEGWIEQTGTSRKRLRGIQAPQLSRCCFMQSRLNGLVWSAGAASVSAPLTLARKGSEAAQHFCVSSDGHIVHMRSQLVVTGSPNGEVRLDTPQRESAWQRWELTRTGQIHCRGAAQLALTAGGEGAAVTLTQAGSPENPAQLWLGLRTYDFYYSAVADLVMDGGNASAGAAVSAQPQLSKNAGGQRWFSCRGWLINSLTGRVLGVRGGVAQSGAVVETQDPRPGDSTQLWRMDRGALICEASRGGSPELALSLSTPSAGSPLVLSPRQAGRPDQSWSTLSPTARPVAPSQGQAAPARSKMVLEANEDVEYIVQVRTSDSWNAGTDERVFMAIEVSREQTTYFTGTAYSDPVELKDSSKHSDPFESGHLDIFRCRWPSVDDILSVQIQYLDSSWLFTEDWKVDWISVYDPVREKLYYFDNGGRELDNPFNYLDRTRVTENVGEDTISISMCAAFGDPESWMDHTWGEAHDKAYGTTYFDMAGGHSGPLTVANLVSNQGSLDRAVKFATGNYLSQSHPWKQAYGTDDVTGAETFAVRASGFSQWDGQCHQMANRLLYTGAPSLTLGDAPLTPGGYGLSVLAFGCYGVGFPDWCSQNDFPPPVTTNDNSIFDWIQYTVPPGSVSTVKSQAIDFASRLIRGLNTPAADVDGPIVADFVKELQADGLDNQTIANLTSLTLDEVGHDEL